MSKKQSGNEFEVICPEGYKIFLEKSCLKGHILKNHPDLGLRVFDIQQVISSPDEIHEYKGRTHNRIYWKHFSELKEINNYLKVPTDILDGKSGRILTAQPIAVIGALGKGGKKTWPK